MANSCEKVKADGDTFVKDEIQQNIATEKSGLDEKKALKIQYDEVDRGNLAEIDSKADQLKKDNATLTGLMET